MRSRHSRLFFSVATLLLAGAIGAGLVLHGKSDAAAVPRSASRSHTTPRVISDTKPHALILGISDPALIDETAKVQNAQLAEMRSVGINSVRLEANWDWVQFGGPGSFDWTELDQAVHAVRAAGLTVELVIDGCPPWAALPSASHDAHPQPASATQFAAWAADVAKRYTPEGVKYFEIWNEPNDVRFWQPRANPAFYTKMLADSYVAIKKIDSSALVMVGGLAPIWRCTTCAGSIGTIAFLSAIYADGAKRYMNAVAVHPYCYPALPSTYEPWSAWSQMSQTSPSIRSVMGQYKDSGKPVWITEFGVRYSAGHSARVADLKQAIAIAKSTSWIAAIYIYIRTWPDSAVAAAIGHKA
ncbi:MAG: cellulase family glycosylhydrolase [Acidimicrobiales bacterium]